MPDPSDGHRDRGIELGDLPEKLDSLSFPVEKEALLEAHGGHELVFEAGESKRLSSVLGPVGVDEFESKAEVFETIYTMVGAQAVGEPGQTGRGTSDLTPPEDQRPPGKPDDGEDRDQSL